MNFGIADTITLFGSLGLFLYGMKVMSDALMEAAGDKMRNILASMTSNRVFAVLTGFLITAVIQSSSATTLMVVSFVNASLLTLTEAIGVILGAHIGTTVTAWLITILGFKVSMSAVALPLVGLGFLLTFSKKRSLNNWGRFIIGFAILFIGLQFLKDSVPDIKSHPQALEFLTSYTNLGFASVLLFLLIGTVLTLIVQSSSATMALTLVMCNEGWLPFDMAAAMVLGENIGTTITANLAAIVANTGAKRAARAHFVSQTVGVAIMLVIFYPFLGLIDSLVHAEGISAFTSANAIPVSLSAFHTSFNIFNTLVLISFIGVIAKIVERMVPLVEDPAKDIHEPKYLNENVMGYPQTAIRALFDETKRLFEGPCFEVITHALNLHREDIRSERKIKEVVKYSTEDIEIDIDDIYYRKVKAIYSSIIEFATSVQSKFNLSNEKNSSIFEIKVANRYIVETIKNSKGLHKNMSRFMASDNKHIRAEYDRLRKKVSKVLRWIYLSSISDDPASFLDKLLDLKEKAKKSDVMLNGRLDRLIRDGLIDSEMATSLANDSDNVAGISRNLIRIAELVYIRRDTMLNNIEEEKEATT